MEHSRIIIAIVLSLLVMVAWDFLFVPKKPPQTQVPTQPAQSQTKEETTGKVETVDQSPAFEPFLQDDSEKKSAETNSTKGADDIAGRIIKVETPLYIARFSEKGGQIISFQLKNYRETTDADSPLKELITEKRGSVFVSFAKKSLPDLPSAQFKADTEDDSLEVTDSPKSLAFTWVSDNGAVFRKTYSFSPSNYLLDLDVAVDNQTDEAIKDNLVVSLVNHQSGANNRYVFVGPSLLVDGSLKELDADDISESGSFSGEINWVAYEERYFITAVTPKDQLAGAAHFSGPSDNVLVSRLIHPALDLPSRAQATAHYKLFFGPKKISDLQAGGNRLEDAVDFGFFDIFAKPCLWLMNKIYTFLPNYGVAIILLTIFIKLLLWPLGNKSYKSMADMKKLQPLMAEIRQKYASDKKKMNEELMRLYRTYKINPMGGCLPMVVQIPVFFALYRMLYEAVELRHAPFFGWIKDLSAPDRLFDFGFSIPFMEPPFGIPVLTIVMGATMFLQQKMSPPMGDPTQAKLMMFMPIIFTVIFINFSSGLVLYWLINNIISIGQQYYVSKKTA